MTQSRTQNDEFDMSSRRSQTNSQIKLKIEHIGIYPLPASFSEMFYFKRLWREFYSKRLSCGPR